MFPASFLLRPIIKTIRRSLGNKLIYKTGAVL